MQTKNKKSRLVMVLVAALSVQGFGIFVKSAAAAPGAPISQATLQVKAAYCSPGEGCNVRSGPGTGYSKVGGYLPLGTKVNVVKVQNGWSKISRPRTGWIRNDLLSSKIPSYCWNYPDRCELAPEDRTGGRIYTFD